MKIPTPYFKAIPEYGDLEMEQIVVNYDYPLLSVLKDRGGGRHLCMCFDTRGAQQWLITPISCEMLAALLQNQIPLTAPFEDPGSQKVLAVRNYETKAETFQLLDANQIPKEDLPEAGEYLDAEPDEWAEYIDTLHQRTRSVVRASEGVIHYCGYFVSIYPTNWSNPIQRVEKTGEYSLCMAR